ncbi:MAG: hypothetical protein ACHQUB_02220 [Candidatus Saccharimonadia bacterium]
MKAYVLYTQDSPIHREVARFCEKLIRLGVEAEEIYADSPEGSRIAEIYDLMSRPSVLLVRGDGSVVERWEHDLPQPEDVSYLAHI